MFFEISDLLEIRYWISASNCISAFLNTISYLMKEYEKQFHARKLQFMHTVFAIERDLIVGGQAVMEGVMMRTPSAYAIACRKSDGSIVTTAETLPKWSDKYKWLNTPVLRGGATLIQSMALGVKALNFSARIYEEDLKAQEELEKAKAGETQAALCRWHCRREFSQSSCQSRHA